MKKNNKLLSKTIRFCSLGLCFFLVKCGNENDLHEIYAQQQKVEQKL